MHGGISDRIQLKQLNALSRHRCKLTESSSYANELSCCFDVDISIEVPPKSKDGSSDLTDEEHDEYRQVQGEEFNVRGERMSCRCD